ncbi:RimJ/RimL family protein N-acetyltransferase [Cryobacterium sp. MP_3.1]|uniref:N-acetyltransferase n=1 Tax=Cryobacterium zongtaii TaxID=1259217 RepID=A0A2S3ZI45_9MICO|nr:MULTISPECIES: GNAT family protein [Cryobacterium]MEC5183468.1 RimJ/RimL family protein N-acetyltransferase [Cryobacterium sp. MP_3.1]POH67247.1 N-acetyltransferase [Cryobacterium zongtaii]
MTAFPPQARLLTGRFVCLEPLSRAHLPELHRAIAHPAVFAGGYGGGPHGLPADLDDFVAFALNYYQWDAHPYAVRVVSGPHAGNLVGTSTLGDIDLPNEALHLGWTAYAPQVWGTAVNPETKLLMLGAAFDSGFGRVKIQADVLNSRSRAAILGIGAQFEGINRRVQRRADGSWRDTAVYSVLADEWPVVQAGLHKRLDVFGGKAVEYRDPRAPRRRVTPS